MSDAARSPSPLVGGGLSRRRFLAMAGGTAGALAATAYIRPSFLLGEPAGASPATGNTLVQVFLRGGADGLSLVPPLGDSTYQSLRPGIAVPDAVALPLDGRFGLHPAATQLKALYDQGRLAIIPAAGSPNPTRSHFEAQDLIEKGTPEHDDHPRRLVRPVDEPDRQRLGGDAARPRRRLRPPGRAARLVGGGHPRHLVARPPRHGHRRLDRWRPAR